MKKNKLYRVGSALLAALMVVTCVPQTGLYVAAEEPTQTETNIVPSSQEDAEEGIEPLLDGDGDTTNPTPTTPGDGTTTTEPEKSSVLNKIALDQHELEVERGKKYKLNVVTLEPDDADDKTLTWASDNTDVAEVDDTGLVTVKASATGNQEAYITVKARKNPTVANDYCHITVEPIYVETFTLSEHGLLEMTEGDTAKEITVTDIQPINADNKALEVRTTVGSSTAIDISVAQASEVTDNKFTITPKKPGTATVHVYAKDRTIGGNPAPAHASFEVQVNPKPNPVASFSIAPTALNVVAGYNATTKLTYKTVGEDPKSEVTQEGKLEWKVTDPSDQELAGLVSVRQDGTVSVGKLPADYEYPATPPTATVSATLTLDGKDPIPSDNSCTVTILKATIPVTKISLDASTLRLYDRAGKEGNTAKLKVKLTPDNAVNNKVNLTYSLGEGETAACVEGPASVTVGEDGSVDIPLKAKALPEGVDSKTCTITAAADDNADLTAVCKVTVSKYVERVAGLELPASLTVKETQTRTLTAKITPVDADDKKIIWRIKSTNPDADMAVLVDTDADGNEVEVTALETTAGADGTSTVTVKGITLPENISDTCIITATTNDGQVQRSCEVTVEESDKPVTGISLKDDLDKTGIILKKGGSFELEAIIAPTEAEYSKVTWSLSRKGIVRVESSGKNKATVTALFEGTCEVIARAGRQTVRCEVTVKSPSMEVSPKELRYSVQGKPDEQPTMANIRNDLEVRYYSLEDAANPYTVVTDDCELTLLVWDENVEADAPYSENDPEIGAVLMVPGEKKLRIDYQPKDQPEEDKTVYTETIKIKVSQDPPAELVRIGSLDKVWNVKNGTSLARLPLPETADIYVVERPEDSGDTGIEWIDRTEKKMSAQINWNRATAKYNPSLETSEQNFTVDGTVLLPGDVRNSAAVSLAVRVEVNVREKYTSRQVERPVFSVSTHKTVAWGTEVVITSETEGASIYYTINGGTPTRDDQLYRSPIRVTAATTVIRAIASKEGCLDSTSSECTIYTSRDLVVSDDPDDVEPDDVTDEDRPSNGRVPDGLWVAIQREESEKDGFAYTGSAIKPGVHVYDHTRRLTEKKDYTLTYKNNVNAADAKSVKPPTITVAGKGNYSGKADATFTIKRQSIEDEAVLMDEYVAAAYTGKAQKPVPALSWNGKKLAKNKDFTYQEVAYSEPGEYKLTVTGNGNYTGTRTMTYEIVGAGGGVLVTKLTFSKISNQEYTGKAVTPEVTVKYKNTVLAKDRNYTVTYVNNKNVGTAAAIITGLGNYKGSKRINFKILPAAKMSQTGITLTFDPAVPTYTGAPIKPAYEVSYQPKTGELIKLKEGTDYKVTFQNNDKAGTASVIFTGMGAYAGTVKKTFKIQAYDITLLNAKMENSYAYEKNGCKPKPEILFGSTKLTEGTDYTLSYKNNNTSGSTAVVTIKGKGNFKGTITKSFAVTMKNISECTVTAADKPFQNKGNIYATTVKVFDTNGVALKAGTDYDKGILYTYASGVKQGQQVMPTDIIPLGTTLRVEVRVTNPRNYQGTVYGTYRIVQADIAKAKVTVDAQTYTGLKVRPGKSAIHATINGMPLADNDYDIVGYANNVNQGTAKVTIRGKGNYGGTKTVNFKIKKKGILSLIF